MKKDALFFVGLLGLIGAFLVFGGARSLFPQGGTLAKTQVKIGSSTFDVEVAKTSQERTRGLGGRATLASGSGMLFVFEREDRFSFWMKNVSFPLDIIWIDVNKRIADITHSAQAEEGKPESQLRTYKPSVPVRYALEIAGGSAREKDMKIGQEVELNLP